MASAKREAAESSAAPAAQQEDPGPPVEQSARARFRRMAVPGMVSVGSALVSAQQLFEGHPHGVVTVAFATVAAVVGGVTAYVGMSKPSADQGPAGPRRAVRPREWDVIVGFFGADAVWAEWVRDQLVAAGRTAGVQDWRIVVAPGLLAAGGMRTPRRTKIVLVAGHGFARAGWADDGTTLGGRRWRKRLVVLRVDDVPLPGSLARLAHADLSQMNAERARHAALRAVGVLGRGPGRPPDSRFPRHLPKICNRPGELGHRDFTDRQDLLEVMANVLLAEDEPPARPRTCVLHGLSGVGKSQLALWYAYQYRSCYDVVWVVSAEQPVIATRDLADLARALGLGEPEETPKPLLTLLWRELAVRKGCLLIFDNALGREDAHAYWPPTDCEAAVIVTSRNPNWSQDEARLVHVRPFAPTDSAEFLLRHSVFDPADAANSGSAGGTAGSAASAMATAAAELGHLPLALAVAASYVRECRLRWDSYLTLFRQSPLEVLPIMADHDAEDAENAGRAWSLALEQIAATRGATDLLTLCAFLDPDDIPRGLLAEHAGLLPAPLRDVAANPAAYNQACRVLSEYSLITLTSEALRLHRLVQTFVRARLPEEDREKWAGAAVRLIEAAFPDQPQDPATWPNFRRLLPHVTPLMRHVEEQSVELVAAAALAHRAGEFLGVRDLHANALELLGRSLALHETYDGRGSEGLAAVLTAMGYSQQSLALFDDALESTERAITIREDLEGRDPSSIVPTLVIRGRALVESGRTAEAVVALERALRIAEGSTGSAGSTAAPTAEVHADLAYMVWRAGDPHRARAEFERAEQVWDAAGVERSWARLQSRRRLGAVLLQLGRPRLAEEHARSALGMAEAMYGGDHWETARVQWGLGDILGRRGATEEDEGLLAEAERLHRQALEATRELLPVPTNIAGIMRSLVRTLIDSGKAAEARDIAQQSLVLTVEHNGPEHPYVAWTLTLLAKAQRRLGELDAARESLDRARRISPPDHVDLIETLEELAEVNRAQGAAEDADEYAAQARDLRRRVLEGQ